MFLTAAVVALSGPSARADIDPASDVLLNQSIFLPYQPEVCPQLEAPLVKLTEQAAVAGYPLKVAVISSKADLGGASQYLARPQEYAEFLAGELGISSAHGRGLETSVSLLTVMPNGFGFTPSGKSPDVSEAVSDLATPESAHPNDLARAAIAALPKIGLAARRPLPVPDISSSECSSGGGSSVLVYTVPIGLLFVAGALAALVGRRRASPPGA